jgi:hypothetical protein
MAAITSIANPVNNDTFLIFYNGDNQHLQSILAKKNEIGLPPKEPKQPQQNKPGAQDLPKLPDGYIADPGSLAATLYQSQICVYGVLKGPEQLILVRLSPGLQIINTDTPALFSSSSITVCGNGDKGSIFYVA